MLEFLFYIPEWLDDFERTCYAMQPPCAAGEIKFNKNLGRKSQQYWPEMRLRLSLDKVMEI